MYVSVKVLYSIAVYFVSTLQMQMHLLRQVKQPGEGDHRVVLEGAYILMEIPSPLVVRVKTK